jgi:hypothetical protein
MFRGAARDLRRHVNHSPKNVNGLNLTSEPRHRMQSLSTDNRRQDHLPRTQDEDRRTKLRGHTAKRFNSFTKELHRGLVIRHRKAPAHLPPRAQFSRLQHVRRRRRST